MQPSFDMVGLLQLRFPRRRQRKSVLPPGRKIRLTSNDRGSRRARLHPQNFPRIVDVQCPARLPGDCKGFANAGQAAPAACPVYRLLETQATACKTSLRRGRFVEGAVPVVAPPPLARLLVVSEFV